MDAIQTNFQQDSAVGSSSRAQHALNELHTQDKAVEMTDQLMVQTVFYAPAESLNIDFFGVTLFGDWIVSQYKHCCL